MNKEISKIRKTLLPVLKKNKVIKASIFGSYARGKPKKKAILKKKRY